MPICLCITGTDTDAGKTVITAALARLAAAGGRTVLVVKAVQTGAETGPDGLLRAPDLDLCAQAAPGVTTRALALFAEPCSPHLAAGRQGVSLSAAALADDLRRLMAESSPDKADVILLEGAGGLLTPLNERESLCDLFCLLGWPVLLVAANRLGAVNHALLSLEALRLRGLDCAGLVACSTTPVADSLDAALRRDNTDIIARLGNLRQSVTVDYLPDLDHADSGKRGAAWDALCRRLEPLFHSLAAGSLKTDGDKLTPDELIAFDRRHIWHPYTSAVAPLPTRQAVSTLGVRIRLKDGRELVDGMASWWCAIHGYCHPALLRALHTQAKRMPHVMFGGLTHEPAVSLARKLLRLAPPNLEHVFFADSGSVAVEAAIKMALQYQQATGNKGKTRLLTVRGGYHGDTLGAMSVCDPENGMHSLFSGMLPQQIFAPRPGCRFDAAYDPAPAEALEDLLAGNAESVAALILEPIVQGAGGMWLYHPDYLKKARELCNRYGCLLICDEIATGFGRTGRMFACEHANVAPDILCLGKALTGGVMTLAATLATGEVARGISREGGVFMHGPTFMANPLACAVAGASLDLLAESDWQGNVARIERGLEAGLAPCRTLPGVADARVLGAIGVLEMAGPVNTRRLQDYFVQQGVWLRPFNNLIYVMPPYVIDDDDLQALTKAMRGAVKAGLWR